MVACCIGALAASVVHAQAMPVSGTRPIPSASPAPGTSWQALPPSVTFVQPQSAHAGTISIAPGGSLSIGGLTTSAPTVVPSMPRNPSAGGTVLLVPPGSNPATDSVFRPIGNASVLPPAGKLMITERGLEGIHLEIRSSGAEAANLSGGAVAVFAAQLRHSGAIVATDVSSQGSRLVLNTGTGSAPSR